MFGRKNGIFGGMMPQRGMGIMPGDQPEYGMGDMPMGQPSGTPPYIPQQGLGQIGGIPTMQNQQAPQQAQEQRKPNRTLGIIGDALLGLGGQQGVFGPMMVRRREQEDADKRQQAQLEQARAWSNQDWQAREDYKRANAGPEWDYEQDNAGNVFRYDKRTGVFEENPVFVDKTPKEFLHEGMRISVANPYASGKAETPPPPEAAIADLRSNPATAAQFDEIFGSGASARILGGGASNGPGSFPGS